LSILITSCACSCYCSFLWRYHIDWLINNDLGHWPFPNKTTSLSPIWKTLKNYGMSIMAHPTNIHRWEFNHIRTKWSLILNVLGANLGTCGTLDIRVIQGEHDGKMGKIWNMSFGQTRKLDVSYLCMLGLLVIPWNFIFLELFITTHITFTLPNYNIYP
jgi:hypothetical protein